MNRIKQILSSAWRYVSNRYEAAVMRWGEQSWIQQSMQDARWDIDRWTREEIQRKHRYFVGNNGIVFRMRSLFIQFSTGTNGLKAIPNSDDEDWNDSYQHSHDKWERSACVDSDVSLGKQEMMWAGQLFDDGETFIHLSEGKEGMRLVPKVATYEAHRVATPSDKKDNEPLEDGTMICDGIHVDKNLKPIGYFIRTGVKKDEFTEIPADEIIHLFKRRRPGELRGIPEGHSVMFDLHSMDDLQILQMQKAKAAAKVMNVITNQTGEADPSKFRRVRTQIQTQGGDGTVVTKNVDTFYDTDTGAYNKYLQNGATMAQFKQDEPGVVQQQYWDYLASKICCGYNIPKLLVMPYSLQGTVTRADLDICTNAFRTNFEIIADAVRRIYEWRVTWASKFDRAMKDAGVPTNFDQVLIRPPRAPNVDIGYTAQSLEIELTIGTRTHQDVYAERQQDWRFQMRQIAETKAYAKQLAKEFDIDPTEIMQVGAPAKSPEQDIAAPAAPAAP